MSMVNGVWYDTEIGKFPMFADLIKEGLVITKPHKLGLEPNSEGIMIVKCVRCHISRMFLMGHDVYNCKPIKGGDRNQESKN